MPPVAAAAVAISTAFTAAATTVAATTAGGLFITAGASGVGLTWAGQLLAGVALSAISRALAPKPKYASAGGMKISMTFGEDQPQSAIFGRYTTPGDLVYHNSWGASDDNPNEFYVQVIELADLPAQLSRVWINGEYANLGPAEFPWSTADVGLAVEGYKVETGDRLLVKFYDGTQTEADPYLLEKFGDDPDRPWLDDMIGRGIPYVIVTAGQRKSIHKKKPEVKVELIGLHYDRRQDSTAGGTGAQRWDDWTTWKPSLNPIVHLDNLMRGIRDPITGKHLCGGQGIGNASLPASVWIAAMNECGRQVAIAGGGTEPQYRCGLEVRFAEEPATIAEEFLKACQGQIVQVAGQWHVRAGPPGLPVYAFTDDDVIASSPEDFEPFPGLDQAFNAVSAKYPEPEDGWALKDSPEIANATFLAEDGGRRNVVALNFAAVPYGRQVQRLCASALKDSRRFRRHALSLPPEARALTPLDEVTWTSTRRGYEAKDWSLASTSASRAGLAIVGLQERDPTDYDYDAVDELPTSVGWQKRPIRLVPPADFSVQPAYTPDKNGDPHRPAIGLLWTVKPNVTGIRYRVRRGDDLTLLPGNGVATAPEALEVTGTMSLNGTPATLEGEPATYSVITDVTDGEELISAGIAPDTDYEVSAIYEPVARHKWSAWLPVHTPNILIGEKELAPEVVDKIDEARDNADAAAADALAALTKSNEIEALVGGISSDVLEQQQAITEALAGIETGTIQELRGIAVAGLRKGWVADPTFAEWTGGAPAKWTGSGLSTYATQVDTGPNPSAVQFDIPSGSASVSLTASSNVTGQIPSADPNEPYVVVGLLFRLLSGSLAGTYLRPEWLIGGVWTRGEAFGSANQAGLFATWGFAASVGRMQSAEAVWRKPAGTADAIRLAFYAKVSTSTAAVSFRADVADVRKPSEGEIKGFLANGYADAQIGQLELDITGPGGAIAALQTSLRAEFGAADASVVSSVVAVSNAVSALAGRTETIEAQFGGQNLVKNPTFSGGVTGPGVMPAYWGSWDSAFQVLQRNSASSIVPIATAPTRYIARVDGAGTQREARAHGPVPIGPGQQVLGTIKAAGGIAGASSEIWMRFRWLDPDGGVIGTPTSRVLALTGAAWITSAHAPVQPPSGTASFETWVRIPATGTLTPVYFTALEVIIADRIALATATSAAATAATANSAIATINSTVNASFANFEAFVTAAQTAVALEDMAASAYVIRAVAGGGSAGLRVVAWDDPTGVGGALVFDGDNVIAPGTLSTGTLVVTDLGYNMVPDDQLQSARSWAGSDFVLTKDSSQENSDSQGELRYVYSASHSANLSVTSRPFPVHPGQRLMASFQVQRLSGSAMTVRARLQFLTKAGGGVSAPVIDAYTGPASSVQSLSRQIVAPLGARLCRFIFDVVQPGTNGNVRFFAPKVISNEDASVLITPDGAFFSQLQAETAWIQTAMIADAQVGTLQIAGRSVTVPEFSYTNGPATLTDTDQIIQTIVMDRDAGYRTRLGFSCQFLVGTSDVIWSFWRGSEELRRSGLGGASAQQTFANFMEDADTSGGTTTYTVRCRRATGSGGTVFQRAMEAQQFKR